MRHPVSDRIHYLREGVNASGTMRDVRKLTLRSLGLMPRHQPRRSRTTNRLDIVAVVQSFLPDVSGGAERSLLATLGYLQDVGHRVRLVRLGSRGSYSYRGLEVIGISGRARREVMRTSDLVLAQKSAATWAQMQAGLYQKPFVLLVRDIGEWLRLPLAPDLVVFNSAFQRDLFEYSRPNAVLHPPINAEEVRTKAGAWITLINPSPRKGGALFFELAKRLPEHRFLAVTGVWGTQGIPADIPANVKLMQPVDDVRRIYGQTRVLLLPSLWETFGRVAVEAGISGIPTIASRNAGTLEAMGDGAIYVDGRDPERWISAIELLDDNSEYATWSKKARSAASSQSSARDLAAFEQELRKLRERWPARG